MSKVKVLIKRCKDHSLIFVDGKWCGKVSDYDNEYSLTVTNVIENLIDKLDIDNTEVIEEKEKN